MVRSFPSWLGKLLRKWRPGVEKTLFHDPAFAATPAGLMIRSSDFGQGGLISTSYTDDGPGISPPLQWSGIPSVALSVILIVEDADSPTPSPFVHLIAWDIPVATGSLEAAGFNSKTVAGSALKLGRNGLGKCQYTPPDPLPGHGPHRYVFQLFALNKRLHFESPPNRAALKSAMQDHVLSKGLLLGIYERL